MNKHRWQTDIRDIYKGLLQADRRSANKYTYYCIEISTDTLTLWHAEADKNHSAAACRCFQAPMPANALWNPKMLAGLIGKNLAGNTAAHTTRLSDGKIIFMLNIEQTIFRFAALPPGAFMESTDTPPDVLKIFPGSALLDEASYVRSYALPDSDTGHDFWLLAALPLPIANCLVALCRCLHIKWKNLMGIDTLEHMLVRCFGAAPEKPLWICLPQGTGIRLLLLAKEITHGVFCISNDPRYREKELRRLQLMRQHPGAPPPCALILSDAPAYDWLRAYLPANGVALADASLMLVPDFRQAAVEMLVNYSTRP